MVRSLLKKWRRLRRRNQIIGSKVGAHAVQVAIRQREERT